MIETDIYMYLLKLILEIHRETPCITVFTFAHSVI